MLDCILDGLIDVIKILPYLFIAFTILEIIEHRLNNEKILSKNKKYGPIIGGVLGSLPQCGFSAMASSLFSNKVITLGTLIAIFLSTSDEMLPIMLSENTDILSLLKIVGLKVIIGIIVGLIIDLIYKSKKNKSNNIENLCNKDNCNCDKDGLLLSSLKHTLKIGLFILIANILINLIIYYIGEESLSNLLLYKNVFTYFIASLIGLIPNCASSVIITKLYLANLISIGTLFSGLLTGSGIGILLLFKYNKNIKENISILSIIYLVGVIIGILIDLFV